MKTMLTKQVTRTAWQAYMVDENGNPTSDRVEEALNEQEAKQKLSNRLEVEHENHNAANSYAI